MGMRRLLLLAVLVLCLHLCSSCIEMERQAFLAFKRSLIDPSNKLSSWVGQDCCEWDRVECNSKNGHVRVLDLQNSDDAELVGSEVNSSLIELKHLEYLDISSNNFAGSEIPEFFGNFSKLRYLYLSASKFGGAVPSSLGQLSKLEWLDISSNNFAGSEIPNFIGNFNNLRHLDLSNASFGGAVPVSLGQLSKLETLNLGGNSLTGVMSEIHFENLSRLENLDLSSNSLIFNVSSKWTPPFQLHNIDMQSCLVGPRFPHWLQTQSKIETLRLGETSISDSIPKWFPNISSNFDLLNLSHNQIRGLVPDLSRNMNSTIYFYLLLSSNNFEGPLPPFPSNTQHIDLSNNFISGSLPQNISEMMPRLRILQLSTNSISGSIPTSLCEISDLYIIHLSNNKFSGEIPRNCWSTLESRYFMAFANNNLSGVIPSSNFSKICALESLSLGNNNFYGEVPSSLRNCMELGIIDISENEFSGNIPSWIGGFSSLEILSLRSNKFEGSITPELCHANNIRILNLARNKLSRTIPPCFKNFTGMKLGAKLTKESAISSYDSELIQEMKGRELIYTSTLSFLVNLDISSNNLEGTIPEELTLLSGLRGLNLSNNHLTGDFPKEIGNLRLLESLDFSNNRLTGTIPQSISELTSLSYLDLSYNNLSGRIPTGNQLQTLDSSIYQGNSGLCGIQIKKLCAEDEPVRRNDADKQLNDEDFEIVWFYISMIIGFIVGCWGVWGVLFCKKNWRATYFGFVEYVHDLVLMKVTQLCRG